MSIALSIDFLLKLPKDMTWKRSTYGVKEVASGTIVAPPQGVIWTARDNSLWTLGKLESRAALNSLTRAAKLVMSLELTALQPAPVEVGYSQSTEMLALMEETFYVFKSLIDTYPNQHHQFRIG